MRYLKIILAVLILVGCEEYFSPDIDEQEAAYVFSGLVTDQPGPYYVKITKTYGYNNSNRTQNPVVNAKVMIKCNDGKKYELFPVQSGYYATSSFKGKPGKKYQLYVTTSENKIFKSTWEELLPCPDIEEVTAKYYEDKVITTNGSDYFDEIDYGICAMNSTNAAGFTPYYRYECKLIVQIHQYYPAPIPQDRYVYHPITPEGFLFIADANNYADKRIVGNQLYKTKHTLFNIRVDTLIPELPEFELKHRGEYVLVKQYSMDEKQYRFWKAVKDQQESSSYFFGKTENQPEGNMSCESGETALGYFCVSAVKQNFGTFSLLESAKKVKKYNVGQFPDTDTVAYYDKMQDYTVLFEN